MFLHEAVEAHVRQLTANGRAIHTQRQAARHGRLLVQTLGDPPIERIRHEQIAAFFASPAATRTADGKPRRPSSMNALRSSVRGLFAFAHAAGYCPTNPARLVRRALVPLPRPRAISEADAEKLLRALTSSRDPLVRRDRAMVLLMMRAGLRVGSLVALDVEDLAEDRLALRLKGGGTDTVFLPREVVDALVEVIGDRRGGPMLEREGGGRMTTRQVARRLAQHARRAGIVGNVGPHRLRHAFGLAVFRRTGDVLITARALCHRSVASTAIYASPAEAQVRAAVGA